MKKAIILFFVLFLVGTSNGECSSFDTEIKINREVSLDNDNLKIKLLRIIEDKRCPKFIDCYWSGYVKAEIVISVGKIDYGHHFISDINNESYNLTNVISVSSYKIRFAGISSAKTDVNPDDYVIRLVVTKHIRG